MQEGYKLVRYLSDGHIAERKNHIADRLLRKGLVEIIEEPKARVLKSPFGKGGEDPPEPEGKPPAGGNGAGSPAAKPKAKAASGRSGSGGK